MNSAFEGPGSKKSSPAGFLPRKLAVLPIRLYQYCISPFFPGCCRFYPSCSAYAGEAVLTHGLLKGFFLAAWRVLRCHPYCRGGYDPVPAAKSLRAKQRKRN